MTEDKFFDRKYYLEILEKRIGGLLEGYRQNIAIVGDELAGKTTIVFKFLNKFFNNRVILLYLEIRPEPLPAFARRFIGVLLYNFLTNSGIPLKEDLDFLLNKSSRFIPETVEKIKMLLSAINRRKTNNIFTELLSLCEIIHHETGKPCVIILDEFLNLEKLGFKNLYYEWSKLLISQKNTMYIIISSLKFKTKTILAKNLSLLFSNFELITVEPFDVKTSGLYLEHKFHGLSLNAALKNFLVHFTGGCPFYMDVISDALLKSGKSAISSLMGFNLSEILENILFDSSGILNQRFANYIKRFQDSANSNDYISILYLISSGRNKIRDIAHILRKTKKELILRINQLLELGAIDRSADFLKINDRVFSFWLKFVYQKRLDSLSFDAKNQKAEFKKNLEDMIKEFFLNLDKSLIERTTEVLQLFENEMIQIERKKIKLSRFREIKPLEFNNKDLKTGLICRSNDSLWIMAFKNDLLTEEDITSFIKECKKYRHKPQRRIIVSLQDIETNARLKALEEKIWTWDINNLNLILDLYAKPWVIG